MVSTQYIKQALSNCPPFEFPGHSRATPVNGDVVNHLTQVADRTSDLTFCLRFKNLKRPEMRQYPHFGTLQPAPGLRPRSIPSGHSNRRLTAVTSRLCLEVEQPGVPTHPGREQNEPVGILLQHLHMAPRMCVLCVVGTPHDGKLGGKCRPISSLLALP